MGKLRRSIMLAGRNRELFTVLKQVEVSFNPFDNCSATARNLLKKFQTRPVREKNPKLEVKTTMGPGCVPSKIMIEYQDGTFQTLFPDFRPSKDVLDEIRIIATKKQIGEVDPFNFKR